MTNLVLLHMVQPSKALIAEAAAERCLTVARPDVTLHVVGMAEPLRTVLASVRLKGVVVLLDVSLQSLQGRILLAALRTLMLLRPGMVVVVVLEESPMTLEHLVARQTVELRLGDGGLRQRLATSLPDGFAGRWCDGDCCFVRTKGTVLVDVHDDVLCFLDLRARSFVLGYRIEQLLE